MNDATKSTFPPEGYRTLCPSGAVAYSVEQENELCKQFAAELMDLTHNGNVLGAKVKGMAALVMYDDGEVYTHHVALDKDAMLAIGALQSMILHLNSEDHALQAKVNNGLRLAYPMSRSALECGRRALTCMTEQLRRDGIERERQAQRFEDEAARLRGLGPDQLDQEGQ